MSALLVACSGSDGAGTPANPPDTTSLDTTASETTDDASPASTATPTPQPTAEPTTAPTLQPTTTDTRAPLAAPAGDAFFLPPTPMPGEAPGDVIWARAIADPPAGSRGWQVLYRSESVAGDPVAVSGVVFTPDNPVAPELPVLSWAHGTTGLGDSCAPSRAYTIDGSSEWQLAQVVLGFGWAFVATDYEGLGTPGVHPYLVGQSEGRGVLDIVRAAQQLDGSAVGPTSQVAIFGHSQGGHAALMAAELASSYAPELDVVGTVAAAPPGDIALIESSSAASTGELAGGFSLMIDAGFLAAYPDLPIDAVIAPEAREALIAVGDTCTGGAFELAASIPGTQRDGTVDPQWAAAYAANSPGSVAPSAPVLLIHGDADDLVPPVLSELILDDYCALGVSVQRTVYAGANHITVIADAFTDVRFWLASRMSGAPVDTSC